MTGVQWVKPNWPVDSRVKALFSLRHPGFSQAPFDGLNLGQHVGDEPETVEKNRRALLAAAGFSTQPGWMQQVHGVHVVKAAQADEQMADAVYATQPGEVCAVMVADCLPILVRAKQANYVAAIHAGWRGLASGVIESALQRLPREVPAASLQVWLGPCIGPNAFEVGAEVREQFLVDNAENAVAFELQPSGRYLADLQRLARLRLQRAGVSEIWATQRCTYTEKEQFFSFRRDGVTGRMAALIGLQA